MRVLLLMLSIDCGSAEPASVSHAPEGFGAPCKYSTDCQQFTTDSGDALGCFSYLNVNYCSTPCDRNSATSCFAGTTCSCVERVNAGGDSETDCFCAVN